MYDPSQTIIVDVGAAQVESAQFFQDREVGE